ncbi:hypothetical protein ANCCAN_28345 [Ancylostoma caninum]|uniref:WD domain, G-beta repeat protein n=1 Tax=Ancylostoma caninum TaxID=29170 RepID=A0A368F2U3_ANCCA|nr:hypothetical protein ANCCAN_28345 [Ancylostoma caninum]
MLLLILWFVTKMEYLSLAVITDQYAFGIGDQAFVSSFGFIIFQKIQTKPQPGSIDSEAGIYAMCYDKTGLRLITGEADKTIKMYKEDDEATEETHPIVWRPEIVKKKAY